MRNYLQKNPSFISSAIVPFQKAHFENFHSKPIEVRDAFLQCGLEILSQVQYACPEQAWEAFAKKPSPREYPTAQWIASLAGGNGRHPLALELSTAMLELAEHQHPWHYEEKLPPEQQFFRQWMLDQAEPGFNDHRPRVSASELTRWMRKVGPLVPKGWENDFVWLAMTRDFIRTPQDAKLMLNRPGVSLYTKFDITVPDTPLSGTKGNNLLHVVALLKRHDQRFLFDALNELNFRDGPNSAGVYGAQAIMMYPGEINTKHGARPAFGMQLPLRIEGDPKEHAFEKEAIACELEGLNADAQHLRLSLHANTANEKFRHYRNVAEYAMYNGKNELLRSAMELGDHVIAHYALGSDFKPRFDEYDTSNSVLYEALEMWATKPAFYEPILKTILAAGKDDPTFQAGVARTLNVFAHHRTEVNLDALPIDPAHPTLALLETLNPTLHSALLDARQMPLAMDSPAPI